MSEENPCIGICEIQDGYCIGCGRSADEIFGDTDSAPAGSDDLAACGWRSSPRCGACDGWTSVSVTLRKSVELV